MNEQGPFSPHQNFAENLMTLCTRHGSIAAVCRDIGMNRQQFNKYLSGSAIPNPATLEKICAFFKVEPEVMFQHPKGFRGRRPSRGPDIAGILGELPLDTLAGVTESLAAMRETSLRPGCYLFYYPWPRNPRMCARAAMIVYKKNGFTFFTRLTKFRALGQRQRYYLRGRHDGIALESEGAKFLVAVSKKGFGEMSLVSIGVENTLNRDLLNGLALVMGPAANPMALRVTLQYRGSSDLKRETIAAAGILPMDDPSIGDEIRAALSEVPELNSPHLTPFKLFEQLGSLTNLMKPAR